MSCASAITSPLTGLVLRGRQLHRRPHRVVHLGRDAHDGDSNPLNGRGYDHRAPVTQWSESRTFNPLVVGSNPTGGTRLVPEVAALREDHRHAGGVARLDHLGVALRAAGLDHRAAPASIAAWGPSAKGKKASEATAEPARSCSASGPARLLGLLDREAHRVHAAHLPGADARASRGPRASTIAFERTWRTTRQANSRSSHCSSVGCGLGHHLHQLARLGRAVGVLDQEAAADPLDVRLDLGQRAARCPRGSGSPPSAGAPRARPPRSRARSAPR